ncbi:MAG: RICIN domain-containing protein [Reinekea sp.]
MGNSKHFYSGVTQTHIKTFVAMTLLVSSISTAYALDDGRYSIKSSLSGMYLDVYGRSSDDGANIIQYKQTGGTNHSGKT